MSDNFKIKTNIKYAMVTNKREIYETLKQVFYTKKVLVSSSDQATLINEIVKKDYDIKNLHISNERLFLTLNGFPMKKTLPESIYSKIDSL